MPSEVPRLPSPSLSLLDMTGAEQPRSYCWVLINTMFSFMVFKCWRWALRFILTAFEFFLFSDLYPPVLA